MIDVTLHMKTYESTVELNINAEHDTYWVDVRAADNHTNDELTIFVPSLEAAETLTKAFEASGATRIGKGAKAAA